MNGLRHFFSWIGQSFRRLPIFRRLLLGNSVVIVVGAIGGTLITQSIARWRGVGSVWLITLFAVVGILFSLVVNYWIVRSALRPLHDLRKAVDRVQVGRSPAQVTLPGESDPDIRRLSEAVNSMLDRLDRRAAKLRALSARAIHAQEEERRRIARGLHDGVGQSLSTLIIRLEQVENGLGPNSPELRSELESARQLGIRLLDELRQVVYDLRPTMLDDLGLVPAIRWYARFRLGAAGIQIQFEGFDDSLRLAPELETTFFRIAQEAINNILRHAGAKTVTLCLCWDQGRICLRVEDDGRGFDTVSAVGQAMTLRHFGLLGIQERAELVGGVMTVDSAPGQGTRLRVCVPQPGRGGSAPRPEVAIEEIVGAGED